MRPHDFNLRALYDALDAQRQARGLSWAAATRQMQGRIHTKRRGMSASTVRATRTRTVLEGDGVLQMLRWLGRTPESFVPGHPLAQDESARLPEVPAGRVLRFNSPSLYAALLAQRLQKNISWAQAAREIGVGPSTLTHLSRGGRTCFPHVMRILRWLDQPASAFTRLSLR